MNATAGSTAAHAADVAIIGGGVIGLSTTYELARSGLSCALLTADEPGAASGAAAGLLAPSVGRPLGAAQAFFDASLRAYPGFVAPLRAFDPELRVLQGLIEVRAAADSERRPAPPRLLSAAEVAMHEPRLVAPHGAWHHSADGAIDNVRLVRALRAAVERTPGVTILEHAYAAHVRVQPNIEIETRDGRVISAQWIVVAAGAWSPRVAGLPRVLPIVPLKGQMLAVRSRAVRGAVMGNDVYLVPRAPEGEIVIGATAERRGFDLTVSAEAIEDLRGRAIALFPELETAPVARAWAGLRPATPDMLPILGRDADVPEVVYACGHSKNGILLAPATAGYVRSCILGEPFDLDVSAFAPDRFDEPTSAS